MVDQGRELAEKHGWFLCRQFENEANANMHSRTTAVEILEDFEDVVSTIGLQDSVPVER